MSIPWVEKYRPKSLREIEGNSQAIKDMLQWAEEWERGNPRYKALILVGKPGCGKTSAARALANDMGWGVIELNASDVRNEASIKKIAMVGAVMETFTDEGEFISSKKGGKKLIIFDEADNLYESKDDRGGKRAIVETIKVSRQPIILIGNDYYSITSGIWGKALRSLAKTVKFTALRRTQIVKVLKRICSLEGIKCDVEALRYIAGTSGGDLRAAINDLQALAEGKEVLTYRDVVAVVYRDVRNEIYKSTLVVLHSDEFSKAKEALVNLDETPDFVLLWIEENMPLEYTKAEDLVRGYEYLSKADVYLGRVMRRQHYALWGYAMDMIAAVSIAKDKKYDKHPRKYNFPSWLMDMSRSRSVRGVRDSLGVKLGRIFHTSKQDILDSVLPDFSVMYDLDEGLRNYYTKILHLNESEISYMTSKDPSEILEEVKKKK
jgi:replication factor C large subunit